MKVAIDGPAGAGKSTIARLVAKDLSFTHLDSGALYRAIALAIAMQLDLMEIKNAAEIPSDVNEKKIKKILAGIELSIEFADGLQLVRLDGKDVTKSIRENVVSFLTPSFACMKPIREKVVRILREVAEGRDVVMEGRDIGTVVLPDAEAKIFLNATLEERAKRRKLELAEKGQTVEIATLISEVRERDEKDMNREVSPLCKARDAVELDTTGLSIDEVVKRIGEIVKRARSD